MTVSFEEMVQWVINNPRSVVLCRPEQAEAFNPKGKSFTPYIKTSSQYFGTYTKNPDTFTTSSSGERAVQRVYTYPMYRWGEFIRRASKLGAFAHLSRERILQEMHK